jgi:hypothetical protein
VAGGDELAQNGKDGLHLPALSRDDRRQLIASVDHHAQPVDGNVPNFVDAIAAADAPFDAERLGRGGLSDLAGDDGGVRIGGIGPSAGDPRQGIGQLR